LRLLSPSRVADTWAATDLASPPAAAPVRGLPLRLLGDERLARLAASGNERAFAVLYERHHQPLYRYARTIVRHDEDARDVLQTTMARALSALRRRGVPDAPMRPWLFRIAHNEAVSVLRRRRPTTDLESAREAVAPALETAVDGRDRLTTLVADLRDLPDRQRSALVMRELSGLSHEEIAGALEISVSAAKQAIFDARTGLQDFAKGRAMPCAEVQRIVSERDGRMLRGRPVRAHLRGCASCRALRDGIRTRRSDLAALAPPLPAGVAGGLLSGVLGGGSSGIAAKVASGAFAAKALAGAAVVATVAVGTAEVSRPAPGVAPARHGRPAAVAAAAAPPVTTTARRTGAALAVAAAAGSDRAAVVATARRAVTGHAAAAPEWRHAAAAPGSRHAAAAPGSRHGRAAPGSRHASAAPGSRHGRATPAASRPTRVRHASASAPRPRVARSSAAVVHRAARSRPAAARRPAVPAHPAGGRPAAPPSRVAAPPKRPAAAARAATPAHRATPAATGRGRPATKAAEAVAPATPATPAAPSPAAPVGHHPSGKPGG
jgi:RNA polymerase sigma factor (sigma-70 family)